MALGRGSGHRVMLRITGGLGEEIRDPRREALEVFDSGLVSRFAFVLGGLDMR